MTQVLEPMEASERNWQLLMPRDELAPGAVKMLRVAGKQIAVFDTPDGVRACDNRCPHEGYPLSEGSLSAECILTCNWHNWKFNLATGENLYGGDRLRTYPLEIRGDEVWIDLTELPYQQRYLAITASLQDAFDDYSYDRMAREIARLLRLGADPLDVLRLSIDWSWQKMEFGWTHAYAGMADWLSLYDEHDHSDELRLVCLVESVAHVSYDILREQEYAFTNTTAKFTESAFLAAIESEDEGRAVAMIRGGIRDGLNFPDFESALTRAALLHYNDFGHSLIYVTKLKSLVERLGGSVLEPLLLSLVRGFIFASREDRIPEFRAYQVQLQQWGRHKGLAAEAGLWRRKGINQSLKTTVACSGNPPEEIYRALLLANAINLLSFNISQQDKIRVSVSGNVGWLDFTHGLTFANAVRQQCSRFPELWPQGLLQMACFQGRNAGFTNPEIDLEGWNTDSPDKRLKRLIDRVLDHGEAEHIVSVHLLKTALAVREEIKTLGRGDAGILVSGLSRFFESPLKRRQARRTAHQSLQFVAKE
jgi:nitrite reductase/ring-hydroxylating ferredoxin subunit